MRSLGSELSPLALGLEFFSWTITLYEGRDLKTTDEIFTRQKTIAQSELNISNIRDVFYAVQVIHFLCVGIKKEGQQSFTF